MLRPSNCPEPISEWSLPPWLCTTVIYMVKIRAKVKIRSWPFTPVKKKKRSQERDEWDESRTLLLQFVLCKCNVADRCWGPEEAAKGTNSHHFSAVCRILVWFKFCFLHIVADFQTFWQSSDGCGMCCRVKLSNCWLMTALHSARHFSSSTPFSQTTSPAPLSQGLTGCFILFLQPFFTEFAATSARVITESSFALCSTNKPQCVAAVHTFSQVRRTHGTSGCRID